MRITALWSRLADYSSTFFRYLAAYPACELQLVFYATGGQLQFREFDVSFARDSVRIVGTAIPADLEQRIARFGPDLIFTSGWNFQAYMRLARRFRRRGTRVVSSLDNPWRGDLRQRLGCLAAPIILHPAIDTLFIAGERQAEFARRLGFRDAFEGLYCANVSRFDGLPPIGERPRRFIYVGRLIHRKGIEPLLRAYYRYRVSVNDPMPLTIAGAGPLEQLCRQTPGTDVRGFIQPDQLPALFSQGQCLILPSLVEHWGVVLHEAVAAGLPLIASGECGATVRFLQDGANGFVVRPEESSIAQAMLDFHGADDAERHRMSQISVGLGRAWTPDLQVAQFMRHASRLCARRNQASRPRRGELP